MIYYKTLEELQAHKHMIIKNLVKEYMVDYHLPYKDALECAQKEYDIKEDVIQHEYKEQKKEKAEKFIDSINNSRTKLNRKGLHRVTDPFTNKIYFSYRALLRAYGIEIQNVSLFCKIKKREGSIKMAMLWFDQIAACYPNEKRPKKNRCNRKYTNLKDYKGKVFTSSLDLCKAYGLTHNKFLYYFKVRQIPIKELTERIANGTLGEIVNFKKRNSKAKNKGS